VGCGPGVSLYYSCSRLARSTAYHYFFTKRLAWLSLPAGLHSQNRQRNWRCMLNSRRRQRLWSLAMTKKLCHVLTDKGELIWYWVIVTCKAVVVTLSQVNKETVTVVAGVVAILADNW